MTTFDDEQREILADGLHRPSEMGEMLRFPSSAVRDAVWRKWGVDCPDYETRIRNIERFKRSEDYLRYKVFKPRFI